ncbi:isoleucine--tRNA ligase [Halobacteriales archaeon QH_1_68_42]|nr:MAG: isoleucine--tRNA ligase [Halobacteriales archaeon QH_1_68_42]
MPEKLPDHYDPTAVEQHANDRWTDPEPYAEADGVPDFDPDATPEETSHAYEYAVRAREDGEPFYFLDGPPFTSGRMHVGNAWGKLLKDCLLRYHRMQGRAVRARPGYDTHGLPVEVNLEQRHGFDAKQDVEQYGVDRFTAECREYVAEQAGVMTEEFRDLGVWMDWDDPYLTMDPKYVDAVWDAFATLYEEGLLERGERVVNTCPRCETAVSDSRLKYEERTVDAAYVGFPLHEADRREASERASGETANRVGGTLATWTTTPWTVVGNQFVAVDREAEYAAVTVADGAADRSDDGEDHTPASPLYVASERVEAVMDALGFDSDDWTVDRTLPGAELVGATYDHPLADRLSDHPTPRGEVAGADYVDTAGDGTGLVHSAPGFGHEDFERGRDLDLPPYGPVDLDGRFTDAAGEFAGAHVHGEGREAVLDALTEAGALLGTERYRHEYPQCPRCDTDVVYRAAEQWLVRTTDLKSDLLDAAEETTWYPAEARDGRFRNTVESAPDWNVSRQRYWGSPLPVWVCTDCGRDVVVGSRAELAERAGLDEPLEDPHRPAVDELTLDCPDCGGAARRVADVLDVWFDSAVASWASLDESPGETPRPDAWPADLVVEGNDQTRGWFLMQLVLGVALGGRAPYEEVLMHGWALLDGEPMSKSRGHVVRPPDVVAEHGRDALRAHLLGHEQHGQDVSLTSDLQGVETVRDRLDVVWNVVRFATLFMAEDGYRPTLALAGDADLDGAAGSAGESRNGQVLDRWLLARLHEVVEEATAAFERRAPNEALDATLEFLVEDVSRFYVQAVRDRVWATGGEAGGDTAGGDATADKLAAYDTLGTVLHACVRLLAPFVPHLSERLYGALDGAEPTVHATDWPDADTLGLPADPDLLADVDALRAVEGAVATARQRLGRKGRWPVAEVVVETSDPEVRDALATYRGLFAERVNAESVRVVDAYAERERVLNPDMSALGPAVGADAERVAEAVAGRPADLPLSVTVDGTDYDVTAEHVDVVERTPEAVASGDFERGTVHVDGTLTAKLRRRGLARDVVRRAQELRADLALDVDERVRLWVDTDDEPLRRAVEEHEATLREAVRVETFLAAPPADTREWTVDGATLELGLEPVAAATLE